MSGPCAQRPSRGLDRQSAVFSCIIVPVRMYKVINSLTRPWHHASSSGRHTEHQQTRKRGEICYRRLRPRCTVWKPSSSIAGPGGGCNAAAAGAPAAPAPSAAPPSSTSMSSLPLSPSSSDELPPCSAAIGTAVPSLSTCGHASPGQISQTTGQLRRGDGRMSASQKCPRPLRKKLGWKPHRYVFSLNNTVAYGKGMD